MKKCPYCFGEIKDAAIKCRYCGKFLDKQKESSIDLRNKPTVRPWIRFWAKIIDYSIINYPIMLINAPLEQSEAIELLIGLVFINVFLEAFFISNWGSTPGKWLCNIKVLSKNGQKLSYAIAVKRSLLAWIKGVGCGIPIISAVTALLSYSNLIKNGITSWDGEVGVNYNHNKIGLVRGVIVFLLLACIILIELVGRSGY